MQASPSAGCAQAEGASHALPWRSSRSTWGWGLQQLAHASSCYRRLLHLHDTSSDAHGGSASDRPGSRASARRARAQPWAKDACSTLCRKIRIHSYGSSILCVSFRTVPVLNARRVSAFKNECVRQPGGAHDNTHKFYCARDAPPWVP